MDRLQTTRADMGRLAGQLDARRARMLAAWRDMVAADASLDAASEWSLKQFNDHFPDVLASLARALRAWPELPPSLVDVEQEHAISHARARWVQGYSLRGVMREWGHFNAVVVDQVAAYAPVGGEGAIQRIALGVWARILNDQQSMSALEYHRLEQAEAETRGAELRRALDALRSVSMHRSRAMEALASTMRNDLQVVMTSNTLARGDAGWHDAYELRKLSQDGIRSLEQALSDMVTLAHLEAGHEVRQIGDFDAGHGFALLAEGLQHVARQTNAALRGDGPESFVVQGDAERVRRLAKHLVFCALRAHRPGEVVLCWGPCPDTASRWRMSVEHAITRSGTGGPAGAGPALARGTEAVHEVVGRAPTGQESGLNSGAIPIAGGDGVDLLIAKHLCELLAGGLQVEADGEVLRYQVSLPTAYPAGR